jgi:hypothetical protein
VRGCALDHPSHKGPALIVRLRERPDPGVGNLARRENTLQASVTQRIRENIGELIIGRSLPRVVMRVGGTELRQHRIHHDGHISRERADAAGGR